MAFQLDVLVTLSVLDRLIDQEPKNSLEAPPPRAESVRRLRAAVRRDLEWLLNTKRIAFPPDPALAELNESVYVYGIQDISTVSISSASQQEKLLGQIRKSIELFEPRLTDVRIIVASDESKKRMQKLDFKIEALLLMDPSPERISFDTTLDSISQSYRIKSEGAD